MSLEFESIVAGTPPTGGDSGSEFARKINSNFNKVDEALNGLKYVIGTYTGNGEASQSITLNFTPSAVLTMNNGGTTWGSYWSHYYQSSYVKIWGGLALIETPVVYGNVNVLELTDTGFVVSGTASGDNVGGASGNLDGTIYCYIAFE